jgi:hypothetical protein
MGKLSLKAKLIMAAGIGSAVAIIGVLPFIFVILPNPMPVKIPGLDGEKVGTYVAREDGLYKLYPFSAPPADFPDEAIAVAGKPSIMVKYRQLEALSIYGLWTWPDNQPVPVEKDTTRDQVLTMAPETEMPPGEYYVTAARDGIYGGIDYFYLKVDGP